MNNLRVCKTRIRQLDHELIGFCIDADNDTLFVISGNLKLFRFSLEDNRGQAGSLTLDDAQLELIKHDFIQDEPIPPSNVLCFEYVVEFNSILLALRDGRILRLGTMGNDSLNHIYNHPIRLDSVQISPGQDLIAISDDQHNITLLTTDFNRVAQSNAATNEDSANKAVGVGWGSKETQFFGLDGRPPKEGHVKESITLNDEEINLYNLIESSSSFHDYLESKKRTTKIDWRGDGQYLASLTYHSDIDKHQLKVWNKNLVLQYMSDKLINIEKGILHWVPDGRFVCCSQRRDKRINEILFLEKNGMVHMRLTLPSDMNNLYIEDFSWSPNSSILAVLVRNYELDANNGDAIVWKTLLLLYTLSNHRFYLKHSRYLDQGSADYSIKWNPIDHNCLHLLSNKGNYSDFRITFEVNYCNELGTVAVIDGNILHSTPTQICIMPPPMALVALKFPKLIRYVCVNIKDSNCILVQLIDGTLIIITAFKIADQQSGDLIEISYEDMKSTGKICVSAGLMSDEIESTLSEYHVFYQPNFLEYESFVDCGYDTHHFLATKMLNKGSQIDVISLNGHDPSDLDIKELTKIEYSQIISIASIDQTSSRIYLSDGRICNITKLPRNPIIDFADTYHYFRTSNNILKSLFDSYGHFISLTQDNSLRCDNHYITTKNCTSFRLTTDFLLYTTTSNTLNLIPLETLNNSVDISKLNNWSQPIENGGTLVVVNPTNAEVILQMPRGNLEIIHPRLLVLCLIERLMNEGKYLKAFEVSRRHRLDLNFLGDCLLLKKEKELKDQHRSDLINFYKAILIPKKADCTMDDDEMVQSMDDNYLILFINELQAESSVNKRYKDLVKFIPKFHDKYDIPIVENPKRIELILEPFESFPVLPLRSSIMIQIKKHPNNFQPALKNIRNSKLCEQQEAIRFLQYHGHVNELFNDAIKIHDTKLALEIAKMSNKDPKEYIPLLDKFNAIKQPMLRYFEMDLHVNNYIAAQIHLIEHHIHEVEHMDENEWRQSIDSIMAFIESKKLFSSGYLQMMDECHRVSNDKSLQSLLPGCLERIASCYADYMLQKRFYVQAGVLYSIALARNPEMIDYFNKGVKCFELGDRWDLSLPLYAKVKLDPEERADVYKKLQANLVDRGKALEAYVISTIINDKNKETGVNIINDLIKTQFPGFYFADLIAQADVEVRKNIIKDLSNDIYESKINMSWQTDIETAQEDLNRLKELIDEHKRKRADLGTDAKTLTYDDDGLSTVDGSEISSNQSGSFKNGLAKKISGSNSVKTRDTSKTSKSQAARKKRVNFKRGSRYEDIAIILKLRKFIEDQREEQLQAFNALAAFHEFDNGTSMLISDYAPKVRAIMKQSYELTLKIIDTFWPSNAGDDTSYSLFEKFHDALSAPPENIETVDIEILVRPSRPKEPDYFVVF